MDLLSVGGIIVKSKKHLIPSQEQPFELLKVVPLPSVIDYVKKILLQVQRGLPVCITGAIGVGKSSLLRFTGSICGRNDYPNVITVQMSDQIDARMLLGAYHSTDLPGQFIWKAGCLTKAILNGHWIVFEDLDSAPMDVITLLDAINDSKQVAVPGYGEISRFHPDFRMFATIRSVPGSAKRGQDKRCKSWVNVNVDTFSVEDQSQIIDNLFPHLRQVTDRIVEIYDAMKRKCCSNKRSVSMRYDLNIYV